MIMYYYTTCDYVPCCIIRRKNNKWWYNLELELRKYELRKYNAIKDCVENHGNKKRGSSIRLYPKTC